MKKNRFYILILIVEFVYMLLELIASRILSPYFGNSNEVWTSVIGIILLSTSLGNFLGGKMSDKYDKILCLKIILVISSIFIFIIPFVQKVVLSALSRTMINIKLGAIISTIILFFIPSICIGLANPIILKLNLDSLETAGSKSGKFNAIATIGGILGTFLGGFVLIPTFGTTYLLLICPVIISLSTILIEIKIKDWVYFFIIPILVLSIIFVGVNIKNNKISATNVLNNQMGSTIELDTEYSKVSIFNSVYHGQPVRFLSINGGYDSAVFLDDELKDELVFTYNKLYDKMFEFDLEIEDTLLIGGGGFTYPRYFLSKYDKVKMDVVEIDSKIVDIAKKYFYLDDAINKFTDEQKRLDIFVEDGRVYLNRNTKKYDVILNDSFYGPMPALILSTIECCQSIKNSLNINGIYMTNIQTSLEGEDSLFLHAEVNTLKIVFKNVVVIPCMTYEPNYLQNVIVIATDQDVNLAETYTLNMSQDEILITDDTSNIERLIPKSLYEKYLKRNW